MHARMFPWILCGVLFVLAFPPSPGFADPPQRPHIVSPKEISEFRDENKIDFTWSEVPSAAQYHVVLSKDRRFKQIIYQNTGVAGTSVTIDTLDYGTYFFRVSAVSPDGTEGPYSETLTFVIVPDPSLIESPGTGNSPAPGMSR